MAGNLTFILPFQSSGLLFTASERQLTRLLSELNGYISQPPAAECQVRQTIISNNAKNLAALCWIILSPFQGLEILRTVDPGRRSQNRFALGYHLSGFQPFCLGCQETISRFSGCLRSSAVKIRLLISLPCVQAVASGKFMPCRMLTLFISICTPSIRCSMVRAVWTGSWTRRTT